MFDLSITVRVIIVLIVVVSGYVFSLFTPLDLIPFTVGAIGFQLIDGLVYHIRFR